MKQIILLLLSFTVISFSSVYAQASKECVDRVRVGKFTTTDANGKTTIIRDEKTQIETQHQSEGIIVSKVKWISEDEFELTIKKLIDVGPSPLKKGSKIRVKITGCTETTYTCTVSFGTLFIEGVTYTIQ